MDKTTTTNYCKRLFEAITVVSSIHIKRTLVGCERLKAVFEPIVHKVTNYFTSAGGNNCGFGIA